MRPICFEPITLPSLLMGPIFDLLNGRGYDLEGHSQFLRCCMD